MKQVNPYAGAQMVLKNGNPVEELRLGNSNLRALSSNTGEFNASDKKELVRAITGLMQAVQQGEIVQERNSAVASSGEYAKQTQERREVLASAYNDKSGSSWSALGASLTQQINEQMNREGFLRRIMMGTTLRQGEVARVPMPLHDAVAVVANGPASVGYQFVRSRIFQPEEFEISANLRVNQLDLEQVSGDLLEESYNRGLESIMVMEDRLWKAAADMTVGMVNPLQYIAGTLKPGILGSLRQAVSGWNLPVTTAIISNDFWADIIGGSDFSTFLDPITKYDLALNGYLGTLLGMSLLTDAFRAPNQKVLEHGEIYVVANPENHGIYTDRGGVRSTPTSGADTGNSTRGWFLNEIFSMVLGNVRSVSKAKRT